MDTIILIIVTLLALDAMCVYHHLQCGQIFLRTTLALKRRHLDRAHGADEEHEHLQAGLLP
jgi:hypothetical protein